MLERCVLFVFSGGRCFLRMEAAKAEQKRLKSPHPSEAAVLEARKEPQSVNAQKERGFHSYFIDFI